MTVYRSLSRILAAVDADQPVPPLTARILPFPANKEETASDETEKPDPRAA